MDGYIVEIMDQLGPDELVTRGYVGPGGAMVRSAHAATVYDRHDATALIESIRLTCPQLVLRARPRLRGAVVRAIS